MAADAKFKVAAPAAQQESPYVPPGPGDPLMFEEFQGMNTNALRPGVDDKQAAWLDGFMPLTRLNLRTLYGIGPSLWAAPAGGTISFFDFANIGPTPIMVGFHSDGGIWQVNTSTSVATRIFADGTILNPSRSSVGLSQWGSQYVLIVADQNNGYFIWDGVTAYQPGGLAPNVTLTDTGSGYATAPTVTAYGGSGTGASLFATVANGIVTGVTFNGSAGIGYTAGDAVGIAFSGGGALGNTAIVQPFVNSGTISSVSILNHGLGYVAATASVVGGGGGSGGSITLTVASGTISNAVVSAVGTNYASAPTILISDPANPVAQATANLMPFGISGTAIETYSGRVWVVNGATVSYTAPGSFSDFSSASGGGNFTSSDSFLRVQYTQAKQTNGFLYLIGDSSVNYISGVQTTATGSPSVLITTFTNQNADPEVGTPWPGTVDVFGRNILFANAFGAHVSYGAAVTKISDDLDGVYTSLPNFGNLVPSAAKAIIFGKKVWILLLPIIDPISQQQTNKLFMWNGKHWWASSQDVSLLYIQHQEINSIITAYGTDGLNVYPLFSTPSNAFKKVAQSKLWANPGGYRETKAVSRLWGVFQYYSLLSSEVDISIDSENGSDLSTVPTGPPTGIWKNASGVVGVWKNASGVVGAWGSGGLFVIPPQAVGQYGALVGMTAQTNCADMAIVSLAMDTQLVQYRG